MLIRTPDQDIERILFTEKTIAESHKSYRPFSFTPFPYLPRAECSPRTRGR